MWFRKFSLDFFFHTKRKGLYKSYLCRKNIITIPHCYPSLWSMFYRTLPFKRKHNIQFKKKKKTGVEPEYFLQIELEFCAMKICIHIHIKEIAIYCQDWILLAVYCQDFIFFLPPPTFFGCCCFSSTLYLVN